MFRWAFRKLVGVACEGLFPPQDTATSRADTAGDHLDHHYGSHQHQGP